MKFMHISDLHLGKKVHEFCMIEDQKYMLECIINILVDNNVEALVIAGDVYDKSIPSIEAIKLFENFLETLISKKIHVLIISGNHDSNSRLSYLGDILKHSNIHISPEYNGEINKIRINEVNFYLFPFLKPPTIKKYCENISDYNSMMQFLINSIKLEHSEKNVAIVHQFILGANTSDSEEISVGGIDNIDYSLFEHFDYVALGHLHRPQKVAKLNIRYSGSILKYSFSEVKDNKSCVIVDTNEFTYILEPLIPKYDLVKIKGYYDELVSKDYYATLNLNNYYHITLLDEDNIFDAMNKLRVIYSKLMKLEYDNKRTNSTNEIKVLKNKSPLDFFEELYFVQNNTNMLDVQKEEAIELINEIWGEL